MPSPPAPRDRHVSDAATAPPPITGAPTSVTAFVGYTSGGVAHRAQDVASFADFQRLYGGLAADSALGYGVQQFFQNGGTHAVVVRTPGADGGLPGTADIIGEPAAFSGLYALLKVDVFNLLCIPDAARASADDAAVPDPAIDAAAIYAAAMAVCQQRRAFLLVDPPADVTTAAAAAAWKRNRLSLSDPDGAAYFPRLTMADPLNQGQPRAFAPSGVVAGVYATTDARSGVWKAPAGAGASLYGVQALASPVSDEDNATLNALAINCFRSFPGVGPVLWGARTLAGADALASEWKYVPVRRTALFIEESIRRGTQWAASGANAEPLWASIRLAVGTFMQGLFRQGALQGSKAEQAFFIKCDSGTTTPADIAAGVVNLVVGFAPMKPAEFVILRIALTAQPGRPAAPVPVGPAVRPIAAATIKPIVTPGVRKLPRQPWRRKGDGGN